MSSERKRTLKTVCVVVGVGVGSQFVKKKNGRNELVVVFGNDVDIRMQKKNRKTTIEQFASSSVSASAAKLSKGKPENNLRTT